MTCLRSPSYRKEKGWVGTGPPRPVWVRDTGFPRSVGSLWVQLALPLLCPAPAAGGHGADCWLVSMATADEPASDDGRTASLQLCLGV